MGGDWESQRENGERKDGIRNEHSHFSVPFLSFTE